MAGIDPSSKRIAVAVVGPCDGAEARLRWATCSLPLPPTLTGRCAAAHGELVAWLGVELGGVDVVYVEEPFIPRDRRQVPTHLFLFGVTLAALGEALPGVRVELVGANTWKMLALGKGHGRATPGEYVAWARSVGYDGRIEDEAAALGVATAGGVLEERRGG